MDKISVIVPAYNAEKTIRKCVESLLNQTYKEMEIIIINDGSTDSTQKILDEYSSEPKLVVINQKNSGIGAARNKGLDIATGNYVGFVDSDDYVDFTMYEKLLNKLNKSSADIVVCDYYEFSSDKKRKILVGEKEKFNCNLKSNPRIINSIDYSPWNKLYKKELFNDISFPIGVKYEDMNTILKVFKKANKIVKLSEPLYYYLINFSGETQTIDKRNLDVYYIIKDIIEYFCDEKDNYEVWSEIEKLSVRKLFYGLTSTIKLNNLNLSLKYKDDIIELLDSNFKNWRKNNLSQFSKLKRIVITHKLTCKMWLKHVMKKKNIIFFMYKLDIGGIETAMLNLLHNLDYNKYNVTMLLEKHDGIFFNQIPKTVKIKKYCTSKNKNKYIRKIINLFSYGLWIITNYHRYDFAANFTTYRRPLSLLCLKASKNNAIWIHGDCSFFECEKDIKLYYDKIKLTKFKHVVFVSNNNKKNLEKVYPEIETKGIVIHNLIDYERIVKLSNTNHIKKDYNKINLLFVGRLEERYKKVSFLLSVIKYLKDKKYSIVLRIVGDGENKNDYVKMVNELNIQDCVVFVGKKSNPYPFFKQSDILLLSSVNEGNPVVFLESKVLGIPIITTDVSDAMEDINTRYGIIVERDVLKFSEAIINVFEGKIKFEEKFNAKLYNEDSLKELYKIM